VLLLGHVAAAPIAAALRCLTAVPAVTYVHADEFRVWPRRCSFAMSHSDAVIAVSRHSERMAIASGASPDRVHQIHNGVDLPVIDRDHEMRGDAPPTVLTVARMTDLHKGHDVMLRAMPLVLRRVPNARWVVVGDGPLKFSYQQTARDLGIDAAVLFQGEVDDAERDTWFRRAHVFAMPTRVPPGGLGGEGFGIAYLEAAAHRLPVVAANEGGAIDAVDAGRTGTLIDPTDHVALAEALVSLLADPERARGMGEAGFRWAARFLWQATAERVADVLRSAATGNTSA
jgi:phosphatidylinositol alpha-1,6-mannosyltransferase